MNRRPLQRTIAEYRRIGTFFKKLQPLWIVRCTAAHSLEPLVQRKRIRDLAPVQIHRFSSDVVNCNKPIATAAVGATDFTPQKRCACKSDQFRAA